MGNEKSVDDKGTEFEQIQEAQAVQDAIFADTFDVAEKVDDTQGDPKEDDDEGKQKAAPAADQKPDQKPDQGDDQSGKQNADADAGKKPDASAKDNKGGSDDKGEDFEQKWKSLQGHLKADREKYEAEKTELLTELEDLKKTVAKLSATDEKKKGADKSDSLFDDLTDEQKAELSDYEKDFDSVSKMEGLKRERALKKLEDRILAALEAKTNELNEKFTSRVQPIEKSFKETDEKSHFTTIREAHSDFEAHRDSGAILKWIESKPRYIQDSMKATYEQGTAEDVVDLITDFKRENGLLETNKNDQLQADNLIDMQKKKAEKKQNLTAVITKRGSVDANQARADDFDSAYNEALKK